MSRHIHVYFPPRARLTAVADALAIAAGAQFAFNDVEGNKFLQVDSVSLHSLPTSPFLASIQFQDGRGKPHSVHYHFEFGNEGERGMLLPYDEHWLAWAWAVVEQLGGAIRIDEYAGGFDLEAPSRWPADADDTDFDELQKLVTGVRRVSASDVRAAAAKLAEVDT